jgi:hypothetical protein
MGVYGCFAKSFITALLRGTKQSLSYAERMSYVEIASYLAMTIRRDMGIYRCF